MQFGAPASGRPRLGRQALAAALPPSPVAVHPRRSSPLWPPPTHRAPSRRVPICLLGQANSRRAVGQGAACLRPSSPQLRHPPQPVPPHLCPAHAAHLRVPLAAAAGSTSHRLGPCHRWLRGRLALSQVPAARQAVIGSCHPIAVDKRGLSPPNACARHHQPRWNPSRAGVPRRLAALSPATYGPPQVMRRGNASRP